MQNFDLAVLKAVNSVYYKNNMVPVYKTCYTYLLFYSKLPVLHSILLCKTGFKGQRHLGWFTYLRDFIVSNINNH